MSSDSSAQPSPLTPDGEFYNIPAIQVALGDLANARNSIASQHSFTSSSLYPASTSSSSHADSSLLPYSEDGDTDRERDNAFGPTIVSPSSTEFDPDDVSYRLRLLVNNSYFLPPAHAKPSPLSLKPPQLDPTTKPHKSANTTFLDFFRIGKSKSKPTTPTATSPPTNDGPILRTTSDSATASGHIPRSHTQSTSHAPIHTTPPVPPPAPARIVVLRERMDDLVIAAKEAEKDLRSRTDGRKAVGHKAMDDVIDPTDAVDLPPPVSGYPFTVQTSAAYGLGVRDSVGAALLADQLPPPNSPGVWSLSSEEEAWRKALLSEAVSHSMNTSTSTDFSSGSIDHHGIPMSPVSPMSPNSQSSHASQPSTTSMPSTMASFIMPRVEEVEESSHSPQTSPARLIGQHILPNLRIEALPELPSEPTTPTDTRSPVTVGSPPATVSNLSPSKESKWKVDGTPPSRADTPSKTYPLAPPPRKQLINPLYSHSQPDLPDALHRDSSQEMSSDNSLVVRRVMSSPKLSGGSERANSPLRVLSFTPPPSSIQQRISPYSADNTGESRATLTSVMDDDDDMSYATPMETDADHPGRRQSITISVSGGRPSFAEDLHPSPTASAFQDALFGSCRSPSVLSRRSYTSDCVPSRGPSPLPPTRSRSTLVVSPPPRVSTSLAPTNLPPPPRSPATKPVYRPSLSSTKASSEIPRRSFTPNLPTVNTNVTLPAADTDDKSSLPPASSTTVVPLAERRGRISTLSLLRIPNEGIPPAIHSAPAPASPTDFFDRIQAQHNAMDDLETSDDDSSDDEDYGDSQQEPTTTTIYAEPPHSPYAAATRASSCSSRPSIMRLGNFSTPQLAPSPPMTERLPSFDVHDRRPVGNVPLRNEFFTSRKKGIMNNPKAPLPVVEISAPPANSPEPSSRPRTVSARSRSTRRRPATANEAESGRVKHWQRESLQRFDGMLLQHLQSERDTIKRIANSISSSKSSPVDTTS